MYLKKWKEYLCLHLMIMYVLWRRLFVIDDIDAWSPAIRSKTVIRTGKKRCFVDPSIAVAALGASPESLELDLNTFGFIFECLCFRDLRAYSQALGDGCHITMTVLGLKLMPYCTLMTDDMR